MKFTLILFSLLLAISNCAFADTFGSGVNSFAIDFTTIGNPGNVADTTGTPSPVGSVSYSYRIGTYALPEQSIVNANEIGGLGITKTIRAPNKPAIGISWNEAARFANWLNAISGSPLAYKFEFQPGQAGYVANANIQLWTSSDAGYNANNPYRNNQAKYFLPNLNEWYKAAYYDPSRNVYYNYPTGSDTAPIAVESGTAAGTAVFNLDKFNNGPADVTSAGGLSPYGTMGQGGNVWEWQESSYDSSILPTSRRAIRGGDWWLESTYLRSGVWLYELPTADGSFAIGFRVASTNVPEPSTAALAASIFALLATHRRHRG